jgi:hypothetical protein
MRAGCPEECSRSLLVSRCPFENRWPVSTSGDSPTRQTYKPALAGRRREGSIPKRLINNGKQFLNAVLRAAALDNPWCLRDFCKFDFAVMREMGCEIQYELVICGHSCHHSNHTCAVVHVCTSFRTSGKGSNGRAAVPANPCGPQTDALHRACADASSDRAANQHGVNIDNVAGRILQEVLRGLCARVT